MEPAGHEQQPYINNQQPENTVLEPETVTQAQGAPSNFTPSQSTLTEIDIQKATQVISKVTKAFEQRVIGQSNLRTSLLVALFTENHVLLESVPGLAKTTAAHAVADAVSASFKRIQCTPDLLPSDILGTQLYDYSKGSFRTELGPVHANFVLLDEINRSSAKTQSAMLEAMQERQTTIGGSAYELPRPFVVLATQNPIEQEGTYELPEAQLDRFLLKEIISYPTPEEELKVLDLVDGSLQSTGTVEAVSLDDIGAIQKMVKKVYVDDAVKKYIVSIVSATRQLSSVISPEKAKYVEFGASPRASIAFMQVARALALLQGRNYVIPEDVKQLRHSVLRHRLILSFEAVADQIHPEVIIDSIFEAIKTP